VDSPLALFVGAMLLLAASRPLVARLVTVREDFKRLRIATAGATAAQRRLIVAAMMDGPLLSAPTKWWLRRR
jgi:hypothetical protein